MVLLEFTKAYDKLEGPVYVNPAYVIGVQEDPKSGGTTIWSVDGKVWSVSQHVSDVLYDLQGELDDDSV